MGSLIRPYFYGHMGVFLIFDISGGELLVILLVVLLFFGSKGIPDIARTMGKTMRQLRDATDDVQREIKKGTNEIQRTVNDTQPQVPRPVKKPEPPGSEVPPT